MGTDTLESKPSSNSLESLTPTLVVRLQSHDAEAGTLLDRLYRDALYRFCWGYLGRGDEAEDAVQDICFKVLRTTDVPENFRPWLYRVARNHCLNLLRARGRRKDGRPLPAPSELQAALTGQLTKLVNQEQKARLGELVEHLSDAHREVLRLRYVEELSRVEIAEILELPESVVKSRLFEGLKQLRERASNWEDH